MGKLAHVGTPMHYDYAFPRVRRGLLRACGADAPTERVAQKVKKQGRPPQRPDDPITDAVLARMRGDHDLRGIARDVIAVNYGITMARCRQLLSYINRCHVEPV